MGSGIHTQVPPSSSHRCADSSLDLSHIEHQGLQRISKRVMSYEQKVLRNLQIFAQQSKEQAACPGLMCALVFLGKTLNRDIQDFRFV